MGLPKWYGITPIFPQMLTQWYSQEKQKKMEDGAEAGADLTAADLHEVNAMVQFMKSKAKQQQKEYEFDNNLAKRVINEDKFTRDGGRLIPVYVENETRVSEDVSMMYDDYKMFILLCEQDDDFSPQDLQTNMAQVFKVDPKRFAVQIRDIWGANVVMKYRVCYNNPKKDWKTRPWEISRGRVPVICKVNLIGAVQRCSDLIRNSRKYILIKATYTWLFSYFSNFWNKGCLCNKRSAISRRITCGVHVQHLYRARLACLETDHLKV